MSDIQFGVAPQDVIDRLTKEFGEVACSMFKADIEVLQLRDAVIRLRGENDELLERVRVLQETNVELHTKLESLKPKRYPKKAAKVKGSKK